MKNVINTENILVFRGECNMNPKIILVLLAFSILFLASCTNTSNPNGIMVGNDTDEYGCKPSAGYSWCESKQKCIRAWEEDCPETT